MKTPNEHDLTKAASRLLRDAERGLDQLTAARLRAARLRALELTQPEPRFAWLRGASVVGAGMALALAVVVWFGAPLPTPGSGAGITTAAVADIDFLTTETPDFYSDLEFYDWLAEGSG